MTDQDIAQFRAFNRFYTSVIGVLNKEYLNSEFSVTEARILYELFHSDGMTATALIDLLGLDKGYLSRIIRGFERKKLIERKQCAGDRRAFYLYLSAAGKEMFNVIDHASQQQAAGLLSAFTDEDKENLITHMTAIQQIMEKAFVKKDDKY
ncbi:MAG TPA: MarR family winged helix-turn-helix transcriptional regulator [Mucilaginibacter sp.]|nr:MarR family winged helix-turn-helix transcriptional regulator [Mucilaginibacter sp.]